ncbi:extensin, partial [Streptomyces ossamyceticus]|nr:extensin [Streptomyces ossamyceticus]
AQTTTAVSPVTAHRTTPGPTTQAVTTTTTATKAAASTSDAPPEYVAVPKGQFDPRALSDFQLDELTHRLIGRITRLVRTELRLDRERIGRLRDPRH